MRCVLLFLIVGRLDLLAHGGFFYDFTVRSDYSQYFSSGSNREKIRPYRNYTTDGHYVEISSLIKGDYVYYSFFNRKDGVSYIFPGSYVVKVGKDGIEQVKIFFINRADTFIRIKPDGLHSSADFYLINTLIHKEVKLPFKIMDIATGSFLEIAKYVSSFIDLKFFNPRYLEVYENVSDTVDKFRAFLKASSIAEVPDGAMNEFGEMVYIKTGKPQGEVKGFNCSGFGKWVADSIYKTMAGTLLKIEDLKIRHIGVRGNSFTEKYEFSKDLFFGLDWTRNIGYRLKNANIGLDLTRIKENDVTNVGFLKYVENRGYAIDSLEFILYYLTLNEPGHMYFGSINTTTKVHSGKVFHKHVVVLFPFIDKESIFRISVMEVNDETSIKSLRKRYPNSYIHLVRVKAVKGVSIVPIPEGISN
ncbi:hypothetical protein LKV13_02585 [Borrelia sp. BU AG58]|uniref:hypothetical protein n=1 Tax=Borrelia sp. BU AG58 TaxID=2887345 RepID=UPI001E6043C5|nr:hypothetical protein [Borrelia sp. BU AG58]UER67676.1 hypothetical protein LKV13_02585 [Borrelia sp. BU AG58]